MKRSALFVLLGMLVRLVASKQPEKRTYVHFTTNLDIFVQKEDIQHHHDPRKVLFIGEEASEGTILASTV